MSQRTFDPSDYPEGYRCACCNALFRAGDMVTDRAVAEGWTTPTCETCAAADAPLVDDHPFRPGRTPIALADGTVRALGGLG